VLRQPAMAQWRERAARMAQEERPLALLEPPRLEAAVRVWRARESRRPALQILELAEPESRQPQASHRGK
jgi:hypothetical protein